MGASIGLSIRMLGAGMMAILAAFCVWSLGPRISTVYRAIVFPVSVAISFLVLQFSIHGESPSRHFITWIMALIIVQSLCLRQGFLHRFAVAAFIIGLTTLPFVQYQDAGGEVVRAGLERDISGIIANPNGLAMWFGFCCVFFAVIGIETKRNYLRVASWLAATACLTVVGMTVSRGALIAVTTAIVIASRHILKRSFLPVLLLVILASIIVGLGLFEQQTAFYVERGLEETGRFLIWPVVLQRFLDSPLLGVGPSNIQTFIFGRNKFYAPHNGFLYVGLACGVIPLAFFVAYWVRATQGAFRVHTKYLSNAPFFLPLLTYAFLTTMTSDTVFMSPWMVVILSTAIAAENPLRTAKVPSIVDAKRAHFLAHWANRGQPLSGKPHFRRPEIFSKRS